MFFNNVTNFKMRNVKVLGGPKYSILIVNAVDVWIDGLYFNLASDGIHCQAPSTRAFIRNVSGTTGDDMVAFTLGDYTSYQVSNTGDMTDVDVSGVIGNNAQNLIKITGSESGGAYVFRRFNISDLSGIVKQGVVQIIDDTNLTGTKIEAV